MFFLFFLRKNKKNVAINGVLAPSERLGAGQLPEQASQKLAKSGVPQKFAGEFLGGPHLLAGEQVGELRLRPRRGPHAADADGAIKNWLMAFFKNIFIFSSKK